MEITNTFTVEAPIEKAWELLTDIPFIAPCMPGAKLTGDEDGVYSGGVKIKVGPVTAEYKGTAEFVEKDGEAYKAVINGKGRDTRGAGNANALITAQMVPVGSVTRVDIVTDLKVSGKVAQFGRGVMQDVSTKLIGQFVECLEAKIAEPEVVDAVAAASAAAATMAAPSSEPVPAPQDAPPAAADAVVTEAATAPASAAPTSATAASASSNDADDVLDLGDIGLGGALAKRVAPAMGAVAILAAILWLLRRLSSGDEE